MAECFPGGSRPLVAGVVGAGINVGILFLAAVVWLWPVSADSWRWVFAISTVPAILGVAAIVALPESPKWLAEFAATPRPSRTQGVPPLQELLRPPLLRSTVVGILLGAVPLVGAWAASKWMIPWAGHAAGKNAATQAWWAAGAVLGGFFGAPLASWLGRRAELLPH